MCSNHVDDKSAIPDDMSATPLESKSHAHTLIGSDIAHKNTTLRCYLIWHTQNNGVRVDITLMYTHMMLGLGCRGARDQKLIHWAFWKNDKSPTTRWRTDSIQLHLSHLFYRRGPLRLRHTTMISTTINFLHPHHSWNQCILLNRCWSKTNHW
jgi:hypothetical protein